MIGGMIWPPVEATASIAPATLRSYPACRISGMVMTPTVATLLTALPEIMPNRLDATTAILAAPPRRRPINAEAMSVNHSEAPDLSRSWPKNTNMMTMVQMIVIGMPNIATGSTVM